MTKDNMDKRVYFKRSGGPSIFREHEKQNSDIGLGLLSMTNY